MPKAGHGVRVCVRVCVCMRACVGDLTGFAATEHCRRQALDSFVEARE